MKDIRSLYNAAKSSGRASDISSYQEAVRDLLENSPNDYFLNLEYIISSDIGLRTFKEFVEKNGLPIPAYDGVREILEKCCEKRKNRGLDDKEYKEAINWLTDMRESHINLFSMYEFYAPENSSSYISTYYGKNDKGNQNRKLIAGMIKNFGEAAIPDALITAAEISESAVKTVLEYIENNTNLPSPTFYEWASRSFMESGSEQAATYANAASQYSLSAIINNMYAQRNSVFREAVITGKDIPVTGYTEYELYAIKDMIKFQEHMITWLDETSSVVTESAIEEARQSIYSLYEELDGFINDDGSLPFEEGAHERISKSNPKDVPWNNRKVYNSQEKKYKEENLEYKDEAKRLIAQVDKQYDNVVSKIVKITEGSKNKHKVMRTYNDLHKWSKTHSKNETKFIEDLGFAASEKDWKEVVAICKEHENLITSGKPDGVVKEFTISDKVAEGLGTLYECGMIDEMTADSVISMLPQANGGAKPEELRNFGNVGTMTEAPWMTNSRDKKTGDKATYIKRNHDTSKLGEEIPFEDQDGRRHHNDDGDDSKELSLDDFRRPSAENDDDDSTGDGNSSDWKEPVNPEEPKSSGGTNNYYYYTYNNSLNKNSNSFNKDNSTKNDDHSTRTDDHSNKHDNHSVSNDDHSTKSSFTDNHHDIVGINQKDERSKKSKEEDPEETEVEESGKPWEIDFFGNKIFTEGNASKHSPFEEAVGDADKDRPVSDHPIKDVLTDVDRNLIKHQQGAKKTVQNVQNVGRAAAKPVKRAQNWIGNMISRWKDADETNIKERLAEPHARNNLFSAIKQAIVGGSLLKAGILLNPVFLFLTVTRGIGKHKREFRIRNEMIGELKTEIAIVDEKIQDAQARGDIKAKYQLMRFKNELNKKLLRVGGDKRWKKIL